ncbi:putative reverse transcriptase domain-containing protein [Tanacetum coccineum]
MVTAIADRIRDKDFLEVFPDDLSGLPPIWEIKFWIELIPRATPVAKSPYRLAPSELEELSGQLKELQDKVSGVDIDTAYPMYWIWCIGVSWSRDHVGYLLEYSHTISLIRRIGLYWIQRIDQVSFVVFELFSYYDCEIRYHPGKVNVVANALSRKERLKPKKVRAMNMTLQSSIKDMILAAQKEAVDESAGLQKGLDEMIKQGSDGTLPFGLLQQPEIPVWKWEGIAMDFVTKLPRTSSRHDTIWVIVDRLTKSAHFLPLRKDYKMDKLARLYLNEIVARHGVPISIISDHDSRFTSRFWHSMQEALGTRLDMSTAYHPQTDGQSEHTIQTLEDMLRAVVRKIMWAEVGEGQLIGPELVQETIEKISQIKDRLKATRDHQKSYASNRRKPLEFSICDYVLLKVSPWKGVVRFGKKGKLAPRFVGPFEIVEKVGLVAYRLDLPEELDGVHDTFHVLNLKKCLADPTLQVPSDEIQILYRVDGGDFVENCGNLWLFVNNIPF